MLIQLVIERLRDELGTQSVFGAAEFYHAQENTGYTESPTYFVLPGQSSAEGYEDDNAFIVTDTIQVVVMRELSENDPRGEAALYDTRKDRADLFSVLLGFIPGDRFEPVRYSSGALLGNVSSRMFYAYNFLFPEHIDPACDGFQNQAEWDNVTLKKPVFSVRVRDA